MRLIDGDELLKKAVEFRKLKYEGYTVGFQATLIELLASIPSFMRCKDCKYRLHLDATDCYPAEYQCRLDERVFFPSRKANNPEWFCADGERRIDETEKI